MKKNFLLILVALFALQCASATDVVTKDVERLPTEAQEFIKKYFPNEQISYIKIDEEILTTDYEVVFVSGTEIDFTKKGVWKDVDCKRTEVPAGIVSEKIVSYAKHNFPDTFITKIEKDDNRYEIELSNDLELSFDRNYNYIGFND